MGRDQILQPSEAGFRSDRRSTTEPLPSPSQQSSPIAVEIDPISQTRPSQPPTFHASTTSQPRPLTINPHHDTVEIREEAREPAYLHMHITPKQPLHRPLQLAHPSGPPTTKEALVAWSLWSVNKVWTAFSANVDAVPLTQREHDAFDPSALPLIYRKFLHWRLCGLIMASLFLFIVLIIQIAGFSKNLKDIQDDAEPLLELGEDKIRFVNDHYEPLAKTVLAFELAVTILSLLCTVAAACVYKNWRLSKRILQFGFLARFVFPFIVYMIPIPYVTIDFDLSPLKKYFPPDVFPSFVIDLVGGFIDASEQAVSGIIRATFSFFAFRSVVPAVLGLLTGSRRGAYVVKTMLPQSVFLGWMVRLIPIFYFPVLLAVASIIQQLLGNWYLMVAVVAYGLAEFMLYFLGANLCHVYASGSLLGDDLRRYNYARVTLILTAIPFFIVFVVKSDYIENPVRTAAEMIPSSVVSVLLFTLVVADAMLLVARSTYERERARPEQMHTMMGNVDQVKVLEGY